MLVLGTAAASPAPEQPGIEYVRNDMPCMAELCVGDDATRLAHVPWKPATDSGTGARLANLRMPAQYLDRLQETMKAEPAVLHAIAAHWYFRSFDADSLRLLAELRAVCAPVGVSGRPSAEYVDAEGFRTVVAFEPRTASPGASPTFIVAAVTRYMPVLHKVHSRAIGKEMAARYRGVAQYASESDPGAAWLPHAAQGAHLRLVAPIGARDDSDANLRGHPECAAGDSGAEAGE